MTTQLLTSVPQYLSGRLYRRLLLRGDACGGTRAGVAQLVELQPSKLNVASSSLVSRSNSIQI